MNLFRMSFRQRGLTLIELMIAVILASLLVLGLTQVFSASRAAYQTSQGLSRVQEAGRSAMEFIQRDLRMVGHMGCLADVARFFNEKPSDPANINSPPTSPALDLLFASTVNRAASRDYTTAPFPLRFDIPIQGFEAGGTAPGVSVDVTTGWTGALTPALNLPDLAPAPRAGSDVLLMRFFGIESALINTMTPAGANSSVLTLNSAPGFLNQGGLYGVANCAQTNPGAAVFAASAVSADKRTITINNTPPNVTSFLGSSNYGSGSRIFPAVVVAYYVGFAAGGAPATNVPALYRATFNANGWTSVPLVEGVETLQLTFGKDTGTNDVNGVNRPDGNVDQYSIASDVTGAALGDISYAAQWRKIAGVRVGLLMRSPERAGQSRNTSVGRVVVNGVTVDEANDTTQSLRLAYESTIALRNRLFGN